MTSQEGEMILKQELEAVKAAMLQCKTEYEHVKQQIVKQVQSHVQKTGLFNYIKCNDLYTNH